MTITINITSAFLIPRREKKIDLGLWFGKLLPQKKMRQTSAKIFINKLHVHVYIMYNLHVKFDILPSFRQYM